MSTGYANTYLTAKRGEAVVDNPFIRMLTKIWNRNPDMSIPDFVNIVEKKMKEHGVKYLRENFITTIAGDDIRIENAKDEFEKALDDMQFNGGTIEQVLNDHLKF